MPTINAQGQTVYQGGEAILPTNGGLLPSAPLPVGNQPQSNPAANQPGVFQGGQQMPAQGTAAYNALPSTPQQPTKQVTVATSGLAKDNFNSQQQGFNQVQQGVQQQQQAKASGAYNNNGSIVDYLNSQGHPSDYGTRSQLAQQAGIQDYHGSAQQNAQLIGYLQRQSQNAQNASVGGSSSSNTQTPVPAPTVPPKVYPDTYEGRQQQVQDQQMQAYEDTQAKIDQINKGTFPLTAAQQAILDSTKASFDSLKQLQTQANKNFQASNTQAMFRTGENLTDPQQFGAQQMQAVNDGIAKIGKIDMDATKTLADLQQGFMDKDYQQVNDQYTKLNDLLKSKADQVDKLQKHADDIRDYTEKVREFNFTKKLELAKAGFTMDAKGNIIPDASAVTASGNGIPPVTVQNGQVITGYQVKPTDTGGLYQIAKDNNLDFEALKAANPQLDKDFRINSGDVINVPTNNYQFLTGKTPDQVAAFNALPALEKSNVANLLSGNALLSDLYSSRGAAGAAAKQQAIANAQKVDPSFSENTNKIRYAYNKDWNDPTSKVGTTKVAINTALGHLADVSELYNKLDPSNLKFVNKTKNWWSASTGDPDILNLQFGLTQLATEIATAYKGGAPSETEINDQKAVLGADLARKQAQGLLNTASNFLSSKISSLNYSYKSTMGQNPPQAVIDPDVRQKLIDSGIDPNNISPDPLAPKTQTIYNGINLPTIQSQGSITYQGVTLPY